MRPALPILLAATVTLIGAGASAQAPAPRAVPEKIAPDTGSPTDRGRTGTLSDRLDRDEGVIKPGNPDPGIEVRPPAVGTTPVIRPPGTSSDDAVRPK